MKNFSIIDSKTGREYWISRSVAVLGVVKAIDKNGVKYILAEQRGTGTPDPEYVGYWCLPCGYLDFDETCKQAIAREVLEETGVNIHPENFELFFINDNPNSDKRQNITLRFRTELEGYIDDWLPFSNLDINNIILIGIRFICEKLDWIWFWKFNDAIKDITNSKYKLIINNGNN